MKMSFFEETTCFCFISVRRCVKKKNKQKKPTTKKKNRKGKNEGMLHLSLVSPAPFCYLVAEHGIERMLFYFIVFLFTFFPTERLRFEQ